MMQGMETESNALSCFVNGHDCYVRASILVPACTWVPEIVNSGFGAQRGSSSHLPQCFWV